MPCYGETGLKYDFIFEIWTILILFQEPKFAIIVKYIDILFFQILS